MERPLVSIIIPTRNGSRFIRNAIESVIAQDYPSWELITVDDGSMDDTKKIIQECSKKDMRIFLVQNEKNIGIQKSLNQGIASARGTYIARLDDDDLWTDPQKLSRQVSFLESHPDHVLVGTDALVVDENGAVISKNIMPKTDADIRAKILGKNPFLHATVVMRADALRKSGGYSEDPKNLHAEDYELWLRLGMIGKMANLDFFSTCLTARAGSLTSANRKLQAKNVLAITMRHRNEYPNVLKGLTTSLARYFFFAIFEIVPMPKKIFYRIQQRYKR